MKELNYNQQGFGVVEVLIGVVAIVALIGTGWYVWQLRQDTTSKNSQVANEVTTISSDGDPDPYADWKVYDSPDMAIGFKHPASWTVFPSTEEMCTGAAHVRVVPSVDEMAEAASRIGKSELKEYAILFIQYGEQSDNCAPDGNDFSSAKFRYLQSSDEITSGTLKGSSLTFFGGSNSTVPDTGIVTSSHYDGTEGRFSDSATVGTDGKTYQITIQSDTGKHAQAPDPVELDINLLKMTEIYKNTLLLLNSIQ